MEEYIFVDYEKEMTVVGTTSDISKRLSDWDDPFSSDLTKCYLARLDNPKLELDFWMVFELKLIARK